MFPFLLEGYQIDENQPVSYVMRGSEGSATGGDGSGQGSPHLPGNTSPMHGGNASFSSYPSAGSGSPDPRHEHPGGSYSPEMLGGEGGESRKRPYSRTSSTDSLEVKPLVLLSSFLSKCARMVILYIQQHSIDAVEQNATLCPFGATE